MSNGCYVTRLAWHHQELYFSKRPVSEVIMDPKTSDKTRAALEETRHILAFASDHGLNTKGAYEDYIATPKPVVSYLVQAASKERLELLTWWFPVVGSVPYLGFYEPEERDSMAKELKDEGYDVTTGGVGAFSSLGWFDDPLFSSMLNRSHPELSHLLIHELIHRTLWISGSTEFNENLAEYCAGVLTEIYITQRHNATGLAQYHRKIGDKKTFRIWLWNLKEALDRLYKSEPKPPLKTLLLAKERIFSEFLRPPIRPKFDTIDFIAGEEWNNATVLSEALYAPDIDKFAKAHECLGRDKPIKSFLDALKKARKENKDPFQALSRLCDGLKGHEPKDRRGLIDNSQLGSSLAQ